LSPQTLLTYCPYEILLRNLMILHESQSPFNQITHIILDEIHLRNKYCDLIMILLKDLMFKYRQIKLVLIAASSSLEMIQKYFNNCQFVITSSSLIWLQTIHYISSTRLFFKIKLQVPSLNKKVSEFYLEDIIKYTDHMSTQRCSSNISLSNGKRISFFFKNLVLKKRFC
jgi:hypothetical protein